MRPHPRIRKTIKWTGAAVTLLLIVIFIASVALPDLHYYSNGWQVGVVAGQLTIFDLRKSPNLAAWPLKPAAPWHVNWWCDMYLGPSASRPGSVISDIGLRYLTQPPNVGIPIWWFAALFAAASAIAWRLDTLARRRTRLNLCPTCNYDRTGLAKDAVCPECGAAIALKPTESATHA
jgi:hypothetical protein